MRRLVVNLDDDIDLWLSKEINQNETIRKALRLYHQDITTDMVGIKKSYELMMKSIQEKFSVYDESFSRMDKLISVLESKMS